MTSIVRDPRVEPIDDEFNTVIDKVSIGLCVRDAIMTALLYLKYNNVVKFIPRMLRFHENPNAEFLIELIDSEGDLFMPSRDETDEFYVQFDGEDYRAIKQRREAAKKRQSEPPAPVYCNPIILAWVHAATHAFPWLIPHCSLLYLERANAYTVKSYHDLLIATSKGPTPYTEDNNIFHEVGFKRWLNRVTMASILLAFKYGASGNGSYLEQARIRNLPFAPVHLFVLNKHGHGFEFGDEYEHSHKIKFNEPVQRDREPVRDVPLVGDVVPGIIHHPAPLFEDGGVVDDDDIDAVVL